MLKKFLLRVGHSVELIWIFSAKLLVALFGIFRELGSDDELPAVVGHLKHGYVDKMNLVETLHDEAMDVRLDLVADNTFLSPGVSLTLL